MADIEPNSPEALAKARKVKNLFFLIAIANIVVIAIVIWSRSKDAERAKQNPAPAATESR